MLSQKKHSFLLTLFLLFGFSFLGQSFLYADGIIINAGATLTANGSPTLTTNGNWENNGTFSAGGSTVILNGLTSTTLDSGGSSFNNLTINKTDGADANDNMTVQNDPLTVTGTMTVTDGEFVQGTTNFTLNGITVAAAGQYTNSSAGDLTLSSDVSNAGTIAFDGNGGGAGSADDILIRSSIGATQRNWQGAGTFTMIDVNVQDQTAVGGTPPFIFVTSGTNNGNNVNWFFGNGTLGAVNVEPASLVASVEGDVDVTFTLQNGFPNDGRVVIDFGSGFDATGLAAITNVSNIDGGWAVAVTDGDGTGDVVTLTRDGAGTQTAAGTTVTIRLEDEVRNPVAAGSTGTYTVTTQLSDSTVIDTGTAAADTIVASGNLANLSVTPDSLFAGAVGNATIAFTTATTVPADGKIKITFPAGFDLTNVNSATSAADLDGTLTVSVSGQTVTITRAGGTAFVGGTTVDDLILGAIRNPTTVGLTGTFTITTTTAADVVRDTGTAAGIQTTANERLILLSLEATPERVRIGQAVTITVTLENKTDESNGGTSIPLSGFNLINTVPAGLTYQPGSASSNSAAFVEGDPGSQVTFTGIDTLPANGRLIFTYRAVVGSNSESGSFSFSSVAQINPIISNTGLTSIEIVPDPIFELGTLIGKVFWDKNKDGIQQKGEPGIPDARVATEEGVLITTDTYGRYHVPDVTPGRHMVKLDLNSLPAGVRLTTDETFLIHTTDAMLNKVNFGVDFDEGIAAALNMSEGKEPILLSMRQSLSPPQAKMDLHFKAFGNETQNFLGPGQNTNGWVLPFHPVTNFPMFVHKWKLHLYQEIKEDKFLSLSKSEEIEKRTVFAREGEGVPPSMVGLVANEKQLLLPEGPLKIDFQVWNAQGQMNQVTFDLQARKSEEDLEMILTRGESQEEIKLAGSGVVLHGESPVANRLEILGVPIGVDQKGEFSTEFILPDGTHDIPIDVYPGGLNPVDGTIVPVEPIRLHRHFKSSDNYFFHVGFGDLEVGRFSKSGEFNSLSRQDQDRLEKSIYTDHRLAYYMKGKFRGKYYLTASIDTEREKKELFRNLEPEDFYSTYGDESTIEYDAVDTQDEVFVMLEADKSYLRYGNFGTGFTGTEFADFNRTLHGFKGHYKSLKTGFDEKAKSVATVFAAKSRQLAAHNEFRGTGGSLYYTKHRRIIRGGEKVKKEVRHKITGILIEETPLVSGQDYEIDYGAGRIRLYRPLHSVSYPTDSIISTDLLEGHPQYLVVDYEYDAGSIRTDRTYGLRLSRELFSGFRIGGTLVEENRALEDFNLSGIDGAWKFRDLFHIRGEYVRSNIESTRQFISDDGGLSFVQTTTAGLGTEGAGYKVEGELTPWKGMVIEGYFRSLDRDFSSSGSVSQAGTRKYGLTAKQMLGDWGSLTFQHHAESLLDNGNEVTQNVDAEDIKITQIQADVKKGKWGGSLAYRHGDVAGEVTPSAERFSIPKEDEEIVAAEVRYEATKKTELSLGGQVDLNHEYNRYLRAALKHKLNEQNALFASHTVGSRGNATLIGLDTQVAGQKMRLGKAFGAAPYTTEDEIQNNAGGLDQLLEQVTSLGFSRKLGEDTEVAVSQEVGAKGLGKRVVKATQTQGEGTHYSLTQEATSDNEVTTFSQERALNQSVSVYSSSSLNRNLVDRTHSTNNIRGMKAQYFNKKLTAYREEENAFYSGNRQKGTRTGLGWMIVPGLILDASYEKGQTQTSEIDTKHHAGKAALNYIKFGKAKFNADFEFRKDDADQDFLQLLTTGQAEIKMNPDWTLLGRWEWSRTQDVTNHTQKITQTAFSEYQVGVAFRPVEVDWLNLFAEYKKISDKGSGAQEDIDALGSENSHVLRGEAAFQINKYFTLIEKMAMRRDINQGTVAGNQKIDSTTVLWANRFNFHVTNMMDFILEYRMLRQSLSADVRHGILTELTFRILKGLRLGVGYNFMNYNSSMRTLDVETSGIYARLLYDPIDVSKSYLFDKIRNRRKIS